MPLIPRPPDPSRPRGGSDPVERWIAAMHEHPALAAGEIGARVVQLEIFCQAHRSTPGELLLSWERFADDIDPAVADYLRHNGIELTLPAGKP